MHRTCSLSKFLCVYTALMPPLGRLRSYDDSILPSFANILGGYVWAYNVQSYYLSIHRSPEEIGQYMSWIPLVGGSLGVLAGGIISDVLLKKCGPLGRMGVLVVSQVSEERRRH